MTNTVYAAIMQPINQCSLMGVEEVLKSERLEGYRITLSVDNFKQYRVTCKCLESNKIISAILFDNSKIVRFKFTKPAYRNKQLTRQLFAYTEYTVKRRFYHSDHITTAGAAAC